MSGDHSSCNLWWFILRNSFLSKELWVGLHPVTIAICSYIIIGWLIVALVWIPSALPSPAISLFGLHGYVVENLFLYRSPLPSSDSLLHCSAVWSGQCDPHSAVAAPTVWWWGSSQLHYHCQSRPQSSHHQWNKCSSHCTLQCDTHCQYCGHQLQWEQQYYHGDHASHR